MSFLDYALRTAKIDVWTADESLGSRISTLIDQKLSMVEPARGDVLEAILNVVRNRGVQMVLVEDEYVDADYLETYAEHYSRAFRTKGPLCTRLHFFRCNIDREHLFALPKDAEENYLGFCILRPTGHQYVSRTVVVPPHPPDDETRFVHCAAPFMTHLLGQPLEVVGSPFIQQDANTFVCAGAAMWSVCLFMHSRHQGPRLFPAQITSIARERYSHGRVRQGLTSEQIVMTLQRAGMNPFAKTYIQLQQKKREDRPAHQRAIAEIVNLVHMFVDSGFPPILLYGTREDDGHAVVVVGHDIATRNFEKLEIAEVHGGVLHNSCFVENLIVLDDARGPYVGFNVDGVRSNFEPSLTECDYVGVVAPLPPEVSVEYDDTESELSLLVFLWNNIITSDPPDGEDDQHSRRKNFAAHKIEYSLENPAVLRPALLDSRDWKRQVIASHLPKWLKVRYQSLLLPKYIWVVEMSDLNNINKSKRSERRIIGEAILDATANPRWTLDSLITFHAHGLLMDASGEEVEFHKAEELFKPYPPVRRSI